MKANYTNWQLVISTQIELIDALPAKRGGTCCHHFSAAPSSPAPLWGWPMETPGRRRQ
jgi:hypothetical protein